MIMKVTTSRIRMELAKVGIVVNSIYDLVNSKESYPEAISVLIKLMDEDFDDLREKEGVVRALAVKEAKGKANTVLISEYLKTSEKMNSYRWAVGNTIGLIMTKDDVNTILSIVQDVSNGTSRQMLVMALGRVKSEEVENVLITLLDDDDVVAHALYALGKLKSQKAKGKIQSLLNDSRSLVRKEAQKALKKIG